MFFYYIHFFVFTFTCQIKVFSYSEVAIPLQQKWDKVFQKRFFVTVHRSDREGGTSMFAHHSKRWCHQGYFPCSFLFSPQSIIIGQAQLLASVLRSFPILGRIACTKYSLACWFKRLTSLCWNSAYETDTSTCYY